MKIVLVIVTMVGLAAVVGALIVGTGSFDGTVVDRPYERGLSWDTEQRQRAESGLSVEIVNRDLRVGKNNMSFRIRHREGKPLSDSAVVMIKRPSTSAYDRTYKADILQRDLYAASVDLPLYGYWDITINVPLEGTLITYERRIFAER